MVGCWRSRLPNAHVNLQGLAFGEQVKGLSKVGHGNGVAHQRGYVHHLIRQPGNSGLETITNGKTADQRPIVLEKAVWVDPDGSIGWGNSKL